MTLTMGLAVALGIQAVFFAFAAALKTDKVTDLSYGLTFLALAGLAAALAPAQTAASWMLVGMIVVWGVRLAGFLFLRILRMGRDKRFDGTREHFWPFLKFWFFQGIAVWLIMWPVLLWMRRPVGASAWTTAGAALWVVGLAIEAVADQQKARHKKQRGARWTDVGLWRYGRHPNYAGEILCWCGVFVFVTGGLAGLAGLDLLMAAASPVAITAILLFLTGVPQLEASADQRWGGDPAYQAYKRRTRLLL